MKRVAILLAVCMLLGIAPVAAAQPAAPAAQEGRVFAIGNPYEAVDWDSWGAYKANLHTHSVASDAEVPFAEMIEEHYRQGFDILSMTDHGVVNKGWTVKPKIVPVLNITNTFAPKIPLTQKRNDEIHAGVGRNGRGMLDLQLGNELNAGVLNKNHVNSYFVDYGQGVWGNENDFETVIRDVHALGGLTVINHPGDWLGSAKDANIARDPKNVRFFGEILAKYDSCLGIEVLNGGDRPTRNDRVLWDSLLEYVIPTGRNVWGAANSDTHYIRDVDSMCEYMMLPPEYAPTAPNAQALVRTAMESGAFFAMGRQAKNELGDEFKGEGAYPLVTRITVDQAAQTITLAVNEHTERVEWVAKGEVIATGNSINLQEHADEIGCYVRAQLMGPGGICFTQPFVTDDGNMQTVADERGPFEKLWDCFLERFKQIRLVGILWKVVELLSK